VSFIPPTPISANSNYEVEAAPLFMTEDGGSEPRWTHCVVADVKIPEITDTGVVVRATVSGLEPGATYYIRIVYVESVDGSKKRTCGRHVVIDTQAIGCTPQKKSCCSIS